MKVRLISLDGPTAERRIVLKKLPVVIGRSPDVDLCLADRWTSRHHCEIDQIEGVLVVRDLESTHGTFVNGLNVSEAHLMPGDTLTVGMNRFQVVYRRKRKELPVGRQQRMASRV